MKTLRPIRLFTSILLAVLCGISFAILPFAAWGLGDVSKQEPPAKPESGTTAATEGTSKPESEPSLAPDQHQATFNDDSTLKMKVLSKSVELVTPYGKLVIPMENIQLIEFAARLTEEESKRLTQAIGALADDDYEKREAASTILAEMGEKAYQELVKVSKGEHQEAVRRAKAILDQLQKDVSQERLAASGLDVITTSHSRIAGTITQTTLSVTTSQFGELKLKLADVRELSSADAIEKEPENVLPDPGNLHALSSQVGKIFHIRVTGAVQPTATIYGTGIYTVDGSLAQTAVHAGALKAGESKVIRVKILGQVASFTGSTQNGFTSSSYSAYNGYEILVGKAKRR